MNYEHIIGIWALYNFIAVCFMAIYDADNAKLELTTKQLFVVHLFWPYFMFIKPFFKYISEKWSKALIIDEFEKDDYCNEFHKKKLVNTWVIIFQYQSYYFKKRSDAEAFWISLKI